MVKCHRFFVLPALCAMGWCSATTAGCKNPAQRRQATKVANSVGDTLMPLEAPGGPIRLELKDAPLTVLIAPNGVMRKTPLLIVIGEEPAQLSERCRDWHKLTREKTFTLCQSGVPGDFVGTGRADATEVVLRQALRAATQKYSGYIQSTSVTLIGLDISGAAVVGLMRKSPSFFSRIGLLRDGFRDFTAVDSGRLSQNREARVWLHCASPECTPDAERVAATLRAVGVPTRLESGRVGEGARPFRFPADYRAAVAFLLAEDVAPPTAGSVPPR